MKKIFLYSAVAAFAMTAISCQKESLNENVNVSNDNLVFTASIDGAMDTKTTLTSEKKVNWEATDEITVNGVAYTAAPKSDATKADFTKKNVSDADPTGTFNAFYPSGIQTGTAAGGTLPAEQTYAAGKITNVPMFATSSTTSLSFKNICAVLAVTVKSADFPSVKSIKVSSSNCALSGAFSISDGQTATLTSEAQTAKAAVTLNCGTTAVATTSEGTVFYIAIPAQTYQNLKIELSSDGNSYTKAMTTKKDADIEVSVNTVYPITFKADADASVLLPGKFTVAPGKQVQFTRGNLYYSTTDSKYHIEEAQNVTYATLGQSAYDATHVCHFFWEIPSEVAVAASAPWAETFGTYHTQTKTDKFWCGEDNKLTVDNQSGLYALTGGSGGEWDYLFNSRPNCSDLYTAGVSVTIGDKTVTNCVVIAPDTCLGGYTFAKAKKSYAASEWSAAEAGGLVCLPAAGGRSGSMLSSAGSYGSYWSATPSEGNKREAYSLDFIDNSVYPSDSKRHYGCSIRLVCSVSK